MTISEAIISISKKKCAIGFQSKLALEKNNFIEITQYITNQFNEGNASSLAASYGYEEVQTILKYGRTINARAEAQCQNICLMMDDINLN